MAIRTVNTNNIHIGAGFVYFGVTVPVTPPVPLTPEGTPSDGTGTFVGGTLEGANLIYRPTTVDVRTQQSGVLAVSVTNVEDMHIEFTIGELTFANLKQLILGGGTSPIPPNVSLGGQIVPLTASVLLVAPRRNGAFIEVMIYQAYFPMDRTIMFARERESMMKVTARGLGQFTRARGDQLGFINTNVVGT